MGNAVLTPCLIPNYCSSSSTSRSRRSSSNSVKLIFWEGTRRTMKGKHIAGEIMFEFPEKIICHADSFFIGHPIPVLSIDDDLVPGQTYFVLPIDLFSSCGDTLSASTIASLASSSSSSCPNHKKNSPINFGASCPFQYLKGSNGRVLIKVLPEFIITLISGNNSDNNNNSNSNSFLCSTPELQKHYDQLVKSKDQVWSPKLETISEYKIRFSPCRFIEWKEKEKPVEMFTS